jgi:Pyridoxamine 5'-phosphate oxidase
MQAAEITRVLDDPLAQWLLRSGIPARLAYAGLDGFPRVVPVGFYWDGKRIVVCTATTAPKVRALAMDPRVSLTIDTEAIPAKVLLIRGIASSETVDGVPFEYLEASRKSLGESEFEQLKHQMGAVFKKMIRITITPQWATVFDFGEERLPGFLSKLFEEAHRGSDAADGF